MAKKTHVLLENARYDDQRGVMEDIRARGECPFCLENLSKYHKNPIIAENKHWIATENAWPYAHTSRHILFIAREHILGIADTSPEHIAALWRLARELGERLGFNAGGLCIRFGEPERTGGTVRHLHAHVIVGHPKDDERYGAVVFRVA